MVRELEASSGAAPLRGSGRDQYGEGIALLLLLRILVRIPTINAHTSALLKFF